MRLDPITGFPRDDPEHVKKLLQLAKERPWLVGTTITTDYKCYPAAASGLSKASSGGAAWSNSSYSELLPVSTITSTFYIAAFCCMYSNNASVDVSHNVEIDLATGATSSEVVIITIPWVFRIDTAAGHHASPWFVFPEPREVAANTRLSLRVRQSLATTVVTYDGCKIMYHL